MHTHQHWRTTWKLRIFTFEVYSKHSICIISEDTNKRRELEPETQHGTRTATSTTVLRHAGMTTKYAWAGPHGTTAHHTRTSKGRQIQLANNAAKTAHIQTQTTQQHEGPTLCGLAAAPGLGFLVTPGDAILTAPFLGLHRDDAARLHVRQFGQFIAHVSSNFVFVSRGEAKNCTYVDDYFGGFEILCGYT